MNQQPRHILASLLMLSISVLLSVYAVPMLAPAVQASHGGDDWNPQGPYIDKLLVKIYGDSEPALFTALQAGELDITDWPVPQDFLGSVCNDANLQCEFSLDLGMFGLDFNMFPSNKFFGVISGNDEQAVVDVRRAVAHLLDMDEQIAITMGGFAQRLDSPLAGFPDLWGQPFDSLHQGPQTISGQTFNGAHANSIVINVSKTTTDVFLIHITGDKSKEGHLGDYAAICRDGFKCATVAPAIKHDGVNNYIYQTYADTSNDGTVEFKSNVDTKTNTKIPLPSGTYIVYAIGKTAGNFGWGHLTAGNNEATITTSGTLGTGGWYNNVLYPTPGYEEYCEARDHLVIIHTDITGDGVPDTPFKDSNNDCRIDTDSAIYSATGYRPMRFYVRSGGAGGRTDMGLRLSSRIKTLFSDVDVAPALVFPRSVAVAIVFTANPDLDDWDMYTQGYFLGRDFDYVDDLFDKAFSFNDPKGLCGDIPLGTDIQAANYRGQCNQLVSSAVRGTKNTFDPLVAKLATELIGFQMNIVAGYTTAGYKAYHNAWTGITNEVGFGIVSTNAYYSWINAYPKKDCAQHAKLLFTDLNGNHCWDFGEPLTMRQSFLSDTQQLNPLWSVWYWDGLILVNIYDTLQGLNPYSLQEDYPAMASGWRNFPAPTATDLGYAPLPGTALTQRWFVKNHIGWSDGKALTGKDVVFSLLSYKEVGSPAFGPTVDPYTYVRLVSDVPQAIVVDVGLAVDAPQFEAGHAIGGIPILPCNVYSTGLNELGASYALPNCGGITTGVTYAAVADGTVSGVDRRSGFDPTEIPDEDGDGIPESSCADLGSHRTGQKGTGPFILQCTSNGTARPGAGGSFVFVPHTVSKSTFAKSKEFWGSPHNYLVWRWADFDNNGVVGTNDKARTRLNPALGCRNKAVPTDQNLWDANNDGVPDDNCIQFDFNRNGVSSDFSDRARMTLEGDKRWTHNKATDVGTPNPSTTGTCRWPWPGPTNCQGILPPGYRTVIYPWVGWVWWLQHQCLGPDNTKRTADDDKTACWFTKFSSRPP